MPSYIVTGGSRGIGFAIVKELAANPENEVFTIVRNPATALDLKDLASSFGNIHIVTGDLTKPDTLKAAASQVSTISNGKVDVLIENAAWVGDETSPLEPMTATDPANIDKFRKALIEAIDVNVLGMMNLTQIFLPLIASGGMKKIIVISSTLADPGFTKATGITYHIPYAASKAAMNLVIAKTAMALKPQDIVMVALCPGWVKVDPKPYTSEERAWFERMRDLFRRVQPRLERQLSPDESANMILDVIHNKVTMDNTGTMLYHTGTEECLSIYG